MAILLLAIFPTALARLLVFAGLRRLGGVQTSLLGIAELLVAVALAFLLFGESFSPHAVGRRGVVRGQCPAHRARHRPANRRRRDVVAEPLSRRAPGDARKRET